MGYDFRDLVERYSSPISVEEETGGHYDYEDGGKWKATTKKWETTAAVFNLSSRDVRGYSMQYSEGGSYTREDIRIHIHRELTIGARVTWKGRTYTVSNMVDFSDHAHGLRIYVARKAGERRFAEEVREPDPDGSGGDNGEEEGGELDYE